MTADIAVFIAANLDCWERNVRTVAGSGQWNAYEEGGNDGWAIETDPGGDPSAIVGDEAMTHHMATHDPAAVLRLVASLRRIVERHEPSHSPDLGEPPARCMGCDNISPCADLRDLASMWAAAEGWDPVWAVVG